MEVVGGSISAPFDTRVGLRHAQLGDKYMTTRHVAQTCPNSRGLLDHSALVRAAFPIRSHRVRVIAARIAGLEPIAHARTCTVYVCVCLCACALQCFGADGGSGNLPETDLEPSLFEQAGSGPRWPTGPVAMRWKEGSCQLLSSCSDKYLMLTFDLFPHDSNLEFSDND